MNYPAASSGVSELLPRLSHPRRRVSRKHSKTGFPPTREWQSRSKLRGMKPPGIQC